MLHTAHVKYGSSECNDCATVLHSAGAVERRYARSHCKHDGGRQTSANLAKLDILRDMPTPPPVIGASVESQTWLELEEVFAALGQLARSPVSPQEFYRTVLEQSVRALSASGGEAWLRVGNTIQLVAKIAHARGNDGSNDGDRQAHEALLLEAAAAGWGSGIAPAFVNEEDPPPGNTQEKLILVGPGKFS